MLNILYRQTGRLLNRTVANHTFKRFFLTPSYSCTEAWNNRLKSPVLEKVNVDELYAHLERNFSIGRKISLLDVDLFVNKLLDETHLEILEDVLFKLRLNPETSAFLESSNHAAVRWYLNNKQKANLLNVLSERLTYGIFLDYYLANLSLDQFLKENDVIAAAKVAVLQMLQEECKHSITTPLALHACYKYLNSSEVWVAPTQEEIDEDELVRVRVLYVRNQFFDDHFDIVIPNHLIGKSMVLFGRELDDPVGVSSQIVGYSLYEKHSNNYDLLENVLKKKIGIYKEALVKAKEYTVNKPKQVEGSEGKKDEKTTLEQEETEKIKQKVVNVIEEIEKLNIAKDGDLESATAELVKKGVEEQSEKDINHQIALYKQWEDVRQKMIDFEIEENRKQSARAEIEKVKDELAKEEQRIFFFDKEREIDLVSARKQKEKENVRYWIDHKRKKKSKDVLEYVPPDVSQSKKS